MQDMPGARAVLVTGVYGTGKTSVVEEIADILEDRGETYAALDLDWLSWFDAGWDDDAAEHQMMLRNLGAVVTNYLSADIRSFILALSIESESELESIRAQLPMPLSVVRLTVPLETIEERLRSNATTAR